MNQREQQSGNRHQKNQWELVERPFSSSIPVLGPLVVGIRNAWNSVAAKWYVRPIVEQQNDFNRLFAELIDHFNTQLVEGDREISDINHDIAEINAMLTAMNRTIQDLSERLSALEHAQGSNDPEQKD